MTRTQIEKCKQLNKERCIAKPETYEARKARREAEITGLKDPGGRGLCFFGRRVSLHLVDGFLSKYPVGYLTDTS
jgi:hypothetical protein